MIFRPRIVVRQPRRLRKAVAAVDNHVKAGRVGGGVGGKVQERTLEFVDDTLAAFRASVSISTLG